MRHSGAGGSGRFEKTVSRAEVGTTDLHGIGYLHRDVKPGNYTTGRAELNELRKVPSLPVSELR